ncbi:MAG: hypothetical protein EZS28_049750, partial [Streblomastix strix]
MQLGKERLDYERNSKSPSDQGQIQKKDSQEIIRAVSPQQQKSSSPSHLSKIIHRVSKDIDSQIQHLLPSPPAGVTQDEIKKLEDEHIICSLDKKTMTRPVLAPNRKYYNYDTLLDYLYKNKMHLPINGIEIELKDLIESEDVRRNVK